MRRNRTRQKRTPYFTAESAFPSAEADALIRDFVAGAERGVANIQRPTGPGRGQADTQYRSIIIEFEKDLGRTGEHAKDQLREYLSGNWNSSVRLEFTLIASDCLTWKVYAPEFESLIELESLRPGDIVLEEIDGISLAPCTESQKGSGTGRLPCIFFWIATSSANSPCPPH